MSRSCTCRRWMDALRHDPRLRLAPLAARALWLLLVDALGNLPEPGVFQIGNRPGSDAELALLVSATETDMKPALDYLLDAGLLVRRDGGVLAVADPAPLQRAAQNRQNGGLGGRPRKGESPEAARARRAQGSLMLPIEGRGGETQRNPAEPEKTLAGARGLPTATAEATTTEARELSPQELMALGTELAEIARLDPARCMWAAREVAAWLAMGATAALLREVVAEVAGRDKYRAEAVRGFGYFDGAVKDRLALLRQAPAAPPAADPAREARCRAFSAAMSAWVADGCNGPAPQLAAFLENTDAA